MIVMQGMGLALPFSSTEFGEHGPELSEPCKSCERRAVDSGGCRQAYPLAGRAEVADPVCSLSPREWAYGNALKRAKWQATGVRLGASTCLNR